MREQSQPRRGKTAAKPAKASTKERNTSPAKSGKRATSNQEPSTSRNGLSTAREPVYLASQLASICDVDLKTIHNWCDRNYSADPTGQLECFRTPGGHLRFRQSSVLRFLRRWGYPLPDALLRDRPHMVLVEANRERRAALLRTLHLVRPGEDVAARESTPPPPPASTDNTRPSTPPRRTTLPPPPPLSEDEATTGLFCNAQWYVHVWDDPYAALVAMGERAAGGGEFDLAMLALPLADLAASEWVRTLRHREATREVFVVLLETDGMSAATPTNEMPGVVRSAAPLEILEQQGQRWVRAHTGTASERRARKRRVPIAPREPIYVASQVANIWNVDLKTVHNWVERGDIEAFSTPGRHLRFRRRSLVHFLRRYNMAIPEELASSKPAVLLVDPNQASSRHLAKRLEGSFEVSEYSEIVPALAEIGARCSGAGMIDAIVVALPQDGVSSRRWIDALTRHADTRYTRIVVLSSNEALRRECQEMGVIAALPSQAPEQLITVLGRALGLQN